MPHDEPAPASTADESPKRNQAIYDEDGIPNSGATAFVIFLLPFLAALATFVTLFLMFWPS